MVFLKENSEKPLYEQVVLGVKEDIVKGILQPNDKIPSVREMAGRLMINPNTISKAYKELENQEVIRTVRGKGTFVNGISKNQQSQQQLKKIRESLQPLILEAIYGHCEKEEFIRWVKEFYQEIEEKHHGSHQLIEEN